MVDKVDTGQCLLDQAHGEVLFSGLAPGTHQVSVEVLGDAGRTVARSDHPLTVEEAQIVVFGATPGGIAAAIAASRSGFDVALLEPGRWVGGMMSGGLAKTDTGARGQEVIGGIAAEFFDRVRDTEHLEGACANDCQPYDLEPHVAEKVFESMLAQSGVIVERQAGLQAVVKDGPAIRSVATSRGPVAGRIFIDASYEGDLMARAGIQYSVGREPRVPAAPGDAEALSLQEDYAGVQRYRAPRGFVRADPYVVPADRMSGTLPFIEPPPASLPKEGDGDSRVMAYTYRLCVTDDPTNQIPFGPPPDYAPARYEAIARVAVAIAQSGADLASLMFNPSRTVRSRNGAYYKYDLNGGSTFSIDMTGPDLNQAYIDAAESDRERIRRAYRHYAAGLLYFWQTDPRFGNLNESVARFGYCADEFRDRDDWPHQLYVREARRMRGEYVMHEADVLQNGRRPAIPDPVGFGAYGIDMHTHRYFAGPVNWPDGSRRDAIVLEGYMIVHLPDDRPYPISYRALTPQAQDATNFLDPVTLSATHVAYSSLRMEPTFMILGEAAGVAAGIAIERDTSVQAVPYDELRARLQSRGQRLPP